MINCIYETVNIDRFIRIKTKEKREDKLKRILK